MKTKYGELTDNLFVFPSGNPKTGMTLMEVLKHREKHGTSIMYFDVETLSNPLTEKDFEDLTNVDK